MTAFDGSLDARLRAPNADFRAADIAPHPQMANHMAVRRKQTDHFYSTSMPNSHMGEAHNSHVGMRAKTQAQALALGVPPDPTAANFSCPLPDHEDHAGRYDGDGQHWNIACPLIGRSFGLPAIRAIRAYAGLPGLENEGERGDGWERVHPPTENELPRWAELLDYEAGNRPPVGVPLWLPDDLSPTGRLLGDGIALYLGLRDEQWARPNPERGGGLRPRRAWAFLFARRFARAWCARRVGQGEFLALSDDRARSGVEELRRRSVIVPVGRVRRSIEYVPNGVITDQEGSNR